MEEALGLSFDRLLMMMSWTNKGLSTVNKHGATTKKTTVIAFIRKTVYWGIFACFLLCRLGLSFESFAAKEFNESFSGRQQRQDVKVLRRFGN